MTAQHQTQTTDKTYVVTGSLGSIGEAITLRMFVLVDDRVGRYSGNMGAKAWVATAAWLVLTVSAGCSDEDAPGVGGGSSTSTTGTAGIGGASAGGGGSAGHSSGGAAGSWHPVRVDRDAQGWPHFFEVYDAAAGRYEHEILAGYECLWIGQSLQAVQDKLDEYSAAHANFVRLWLRPSDGEYAFQFDGTDRVDVDTFNEEFFARVDAFVGEAEGRGIVIEVMVWDRCSGWWGDGLPEPTGWDFTSSPRRNVHHPDNHYRSTAGGEPIPGLSTDNEDRIHNEQWYDASNAIWMDYQRQYMARLLDELQKHDNVAVELINEAPNTAFATDWRTATHEWFRAQYPDILASSEGLGEIDGDCDDDVRAWGRDHPGTVDLVPTHMTWTYDAAQGKYHDFRGVLPGCNEEYIHRDMFEDENFTRRFMWGLVFGGGAVSIENAGTHGGAITRELHGFFHPADDPPAFWLMRPNRDLVVGNDGHYYVLATDDGAEILVFVSDEASTAAFVVTGSGMHQHRWFAVDGASSSWQPWQNGSDWTFTPPAQNYALQIRRL